jgi:hypothetical protein
MPRAVVEGTVSEQLRRSRAHLDVRVSFEPSRLGPKMLADAYERTAPMTRRVLRGPAAGAEARTRQGRDEETEAVA